jgi:uncharacterized protein YjbI with pentapeptide repeats
VFPRLLVPSLSASDLKNLKPGAEVTTAQNNIDKARNDVRTTLVQTIGGALVLLTASIAWAQVQVARRGQITDRFTKSVDQIGNEHREVRVGGIYALNQVADTPQYTRAVAEVLLAYLKSESNPIDLGTQQPAPVGDIAKIDMQAVIRILVEEGLWTRAEAGRLDLSSIDVAYAALRAATLRRATMVDAKLHYADLQDAKLQESDMTRAEFNNANLARADLSNSVIEGAIFEKANFSDPLLAQGANLVEYSANLFHVQGGGAQFPGADLTSANLSFGVFGKANFKGAFLNDANLHQATLTNADFTDADLSSADLTGANLSEATLVRVVLTEDPFVDSTTQLSKIVTDDSTRTRLNELVERARAELDVPR